MPPTQTQPVAPWPTWAKQPKQGKITEYFKKRSTTAEEFFKSKTKPKASEPNSASAAKQLISKFLSPSGLFDEPRAEPQAASTPKSKEDAVDTFVRPPSPAPAPQPEPPVVQQEERTIRFPPKNGWRGHYVSDVVCRWTECDAKFSTTSALIEHLQVQHVNSQTLGEYYVCQWVECKVFERRSCSRTWLERHVLSHGGNKPYRCIVDGCGHRFSSQTLLQRHVNGHFAEGNQQGSSKKNCEPNNKLIRRNGKRLRYRRQPFSARVYDYFDAGIMEGLQHNLIELTERRTLGRLDASPGHTVTLHSKVCPLCVITFKKLLCSVFSVLLVF
ncbi:hypothetical protein AAG570_002886 [Ranatra chinensis]|uniref:C2H2-type domain-containing protein n=1 Tax=Ranatra chinensis TaxID=642074 RepID=A0ABD0Y5T7_9HEMI